MAVLGAVGGACSSDAPTESEPDPPAPVCAAGDLLVSSRFTDRVLRYNGRTGAFLTTFAQGDGLDNPNGIAFGAGGDLFVGLGDLDAVLRFDGRTGRFVSEFVAPGAGGLVSPRDLTLHPNGNLLVASGGGDQVLEFSASDGRFVRVAAEHPDLDGPVGLAVGPDGILYVSGGISGGIFLFDVETGAFIRRIAPDFGNVTGLLPAPDGSLFAASGIEGEVRAYDPGTGRLLRVVARGGGLSIPIGITLDAEGNLLVAAFEADAVKLYDPDDASFLRDFVAPRTGGLDGTHFFAFVPPENALPDGACSL